MLKQCLWSQHVLIRARLTLLQRGILRLYLLHKLSNIIQSNLSLLDSFWENDFTLSHYMLEVNISFKFYLIAAVSLCHSVLGPTFKNREGFRIDPDVTGKEEKGKRKSMDVTCLLILILRAFFTVVICRVFLHAV